MPAASIAELLVCLAVLQLVSPALLQPAGNAAAEAAAAAAAPDVQLLLDLALRELAAGRNRDWLQQQQQQQGTLSDVVTACRVLGASPAGMERIGLW
jgi:hypothetical protein